MTTKQSENCCDDCATPGRITGACARCQKKLCHACFVGVHECEHGILAEPTIAFDDRCDLRGCDCAKTAPSIRAFVHQSNQMIFDETGDDDGDES